MKKPAILFITTDEQHRDTVLQTKRPFTLPGLDALLACSDVYTEAYSVSPVCLPARCSWMSGRYPHNTGSISNTMGVSLSLTAPNLFTCLSKAGYTTSMHGKCHFLPVPYPATRGDVTQEYEHFRLYYKALGMDHLDLQDDKNNSLWYYDDFAKELEAKDKLTPYREAFHGKKEKFELPKFPLDASEHPDSWVGRKALEYLDTLSGEDPHFMWVSFSGPHYPMDAPEEYFKYVDMDKDFSRVFREGEWDDMTKMHRNGFFGPGTTEGSGSAPDGAQRLYDEQYWKDWRRLYYANIVQIDSYIDQIIKKATEKFGEENLVVIFTSDHGEMMGNHSLWGKNMSVYEDVLRIPIVVHHPGQTQRRDVPQRVSSLEVMPTILDIAGAELPENIDGMPLEAMAKQGGRDYVISECDERVAIVKGQMKLSLNCYKRTGEVYKEMYDLSVDPHEFTNIYEDAAYEKQREELLAILQEHEQKEGMLSTVFYRFTKKPYWYVK